MIYVMLSTVQIACVINEEPSPATVDISLCAGEIHFLEPIAERLP